MPTAPIDDEGHHFFYLDSGAPPGATSYTTLVIVHGAVFHSGIFSRMLPFAHAHNLRLILPNRRDMPGSSPQSPSDLEELPPWGCPDVLGADRYWQARGIELATFLANVVRSEKIPPVAADGKEGGVAVMGWSSGNFFPLAMVAYVDTLPQETLIALEPCMHSLIIFDAPHLVLGMRNTLFLFDPSLNLTEEERDKAFGIFVGEYYAHSSVTSHNIADLATTSSHLRPGTTQNMSPEDREMCVGLDFRSEAPLFGGPGEAFVERIRKAAFDDGLAKAYWPRMRTDVIWCEHSPWTLVIAAWEFEKMTEAATKAGIKGRGMRITMMPGANHFPHWDEPERTVDFFQNVLSS